MPRGLVAQILASFFLGVGQASDHDLSLIQVKNSGFPTCTCDCCNTVPRRVDEVMLGVEIKCAPSAIHGPDMCQEMCAADDTDKVLPTNQGNLDYMRFCFFECKPVNGLQTALDAECSPLTTQDLKFVIDPTGNANDPAIAMVREVQAAAQAAAQAARQKQATLLARKSDPKLAKLHAENAIRTATFEGGVARDLSDATRNNEEEKAEAQHEVLKKNIEDMRKKPPIDAVLEIHEAMMAAGEAARNAGIAAQTSLKTLKEGRNLAWTTAVDVGEGAMQEVRTEHDAFNAGLGAHAASFTNALDMKMLAAAEKAAAPYFLGFIRAKQSMADYEKKAAALGAKAEKFKSEANKQSGKANKEMAAGNTEFAENLIKSAKETMERARNYADQAKHFLATAEEVNKGLPDYMAASRSAAARAAWELQPAWPGARR